MDAYGEAFSLGVLCYRFHWRQRIAKTRPFDGELEICEYTEANTEIGDPKLSTDPGSKMLTYSLSGADSDLFTFGTST